MKLALFTDKFNMVSEVGLPEDGTFCIAVYGNDQEGYDWLTAGYNAKEKEFYANLGLGGMVLDESSCIAWINISDIPVYRVDETNK